MDLRIEISVSNAHFAIELKQLPVRSTVTRARESTVIGMLDYYAENDVVF